MTTRTTPPAASKRPAGKAPATKAASAPKAHTAPAEPQSLNLPDHATTRPPAPMGRPIVWTPERIAGAKEDLCLYIVDAGTVTGWCKQHSVSASTVYKWLQADPEFEKAYAHAHELQADVYADKMAEIATAAAEGRMDPQAAKAAGDLLKWLAGKRKPKTYGDRIDVNANVTTTTTVGYVVRRYDDNPALQASAMVDVTPKTPALQALHGDDQC